jgi:hypothetical protein
VIETGRRADPLGHDRYAARREPCRRKRRGRTRKRIAALITLQDGPPSWRRKQGSGAGALEGAKTPAIRIGFAKGRVRIEDILYFGSREPAPRTRERPARRAINSSRSAALRPSARFRSRFPPAP